MRFALRIYCLIVGVVFIVAGPILFFGYRACMSNPDVSDGWVRVTADLVNAEKHYVHVKDKREDRLILYLCDYSTTVDGRALNIQYTATRPRHVTESRVFYVKLSQYHDGYEEMVPERDSSDQALAYLFFRNACNGNLVR